MENQPIRDLNYYYTLHKDLVWHGLRRLRHGLGVRQEQSSGLYRSPTPVGPTPKLSVCVLTMNAAGRIGPLVRHAKTLGDEVVVGVDSKTSDETADICRDAGADVVFTIQNDALTCNGMLEALVQACSGDWVLRLDDDEYMEPEFLTIKHALMTHSHYTHYKFPRLHLCNVQPLQWVNDSYLYPDYQMRLFKNDLSLLHFPGAVGHTSITADGPKGRIFGTNIVHLNLAINSRSQREAKLDRYIERHNGGWVHPINEYALLYEDFNYRIEPYRHPNPAFCQLLADVVTGQQHYLANQAPDSQAQLAAGTSA